MEVIDECLRGDSCALSEVLRCVHVGLLCIQQLPEDRPSMSSVLLMLGGECALPRPKEPSFLLGKHSLEASRLSLGTQETRSASEVNVGLLDPL